MTENSGTKASFLSDKLSYTRVFMCAHAFICRHAVCLCVCVQECVHRRVHGYACGGRSPSVLKWPLIETGSAGSLTGETDSGTAKESRRVFVLCLFFFFSFFLSFFFRFIFFF